MSARRPGRLRGALAAVPLLLLAACTGGGDGALPPTSPAAAGATVAPSPTPSTPPLQATKLGSFGQPVWVGAVPGDPRGHLLLALRSGSVLELDAGGTQLAVVLNLAGKVGRGNEQGLLSVAFDPAYPRTHRLYVDSTAADGSVQVDAYTVVDGQATAPQQLLRVAHPYRNHNGGGMAFDRTGMLQVGVGDGGNAGDPDNRAQDLSSPLGKILRLDPRTGRPAAGNPFPANPYVWALGLRNPWRFSFGPSGELWLGDIGQDELEELDVVPPALQRGANYGWSVFEGDRVFKRDASLAPGTTLIGPTLLYSHHDGGCAITPGEIYAGRALPWLRGRYVYADYCLGRLMAVTRTGGVVGEPVDLDLKVQGLQAFGHDALGELLVLGFDGVYRVDPGA